MYDKIIKKLDSIEDKYEVKILFAIESGSRAWGFPSNDSDYDVRFIYAHPTNWYLSVFEKRDVITPPIDKIYDINGWDIKKTFQLLYKSNPSLMEWLTSPIIYRANEAAMQPLRSLVKSAFMKESACHHYLSIAKGQIDRFKNSERVNIKKYLYTLRPLLCCQWIITYDTQPPILFDDIVSEFVTTKSIKKEIDDLLRIKRSSRESDMIDRSNILEEYFFELLSSLESKISKNPKKLDVKLFDDSFRKTLDIVNNK